MSEQHACTAQSRGVGNDRAYRDRHGGVPAIVTAKMDAACRFVEMGDPQLLGSLRVVVETRLEKSLRGRVSGEYCGSLDTFDLHFGTLGARCKTSQLNHVRFGGATTIGLGWTRDGRGLG